MHDAYVDGEGILEPSLMGLITLMNLRDHEEVARGELMRYFAQSPWYPTALMPSQGIRWAPIDERTALATLVDDALMLSMTFHFGDAGLIETIRADHRGRPMDGQVIPTPWEGRMSNFQPRHGLLIPIAGEVARLAPQGRLPYWRDTITAILYHR